MFLVVYPFYQLVQRLCWIKWKISPTSLELILYLCFRDIHVDGIRGNNLLFKCDEDNGELPNDFYCASEPYKSKQTNECIFYCATGVAVLVLTPMLRAALLCAPVQFALRCAVSRISLCLLWSADSHCYLRATGGESDQNLAYLRSMLEPCNSWIADC